MENNWLRHYEPGVPHRLTIPDLTLPQLFDKSVKSPHIPAILYFGKEISYLHLFSLVNRFAIGLQKLGISQGDRVMLALPNIPQFIISYWAVQRLGAIAVLVNPLLSGRELEHQIAVSGASAAIVLDRHLSKYDEMAPGTLQSVIVAGVESYMPFLLNMAFQIKKRFIEKKKQSHLPFTVHLFRELLIQSDSSGQTADISPDDPAVLLFTGGVTGTPKGALLSHRNLIANMMQAHSWITDYRQEGEVIITALPLIHSYGMTACHHLAVGTRSTMVLYPRFNAKQIVDDMIKFNASVFPGVPTMYSAILDEVKRRELQILPTRVFISGGAPLPIQLQKEFKDFTGTSLIEGYGLTEASPVTHCNPVNGIHKDNSIGIPWPGTEARIVHPETRKELLTDAIGELEIKGPQVMQSYWQEPNSVSQVIDDKGWLRTGDFAFRDIDGYFYIADRIKDVIFYGGESVYPSEIENLLCKHPKIKEAAIVGVDDEYYGQVIKAVIVSKGPDIITTDEVISYCSEHLAKFQIPKFIEFTDKLPKNYLGKILKRQLMS